MQDTRRRILFLSTLLGVMFGIAAYLVYKSIAADRLVLLVTLLPLAIAAIPLTREFRRLLRTSGQDVSLPS